MVLRRVGRRLLHAVANRRSTHGPVVLAAVGLERWHLLSPVLARRLIECFGDDTLSVRRKVMLAGGQPLDLCMRVTAPDAMALLFDDIFAHAREGTTCRVFAALAASATTICDVGANIGLYTYLAASVAPHAPIVAFEPLPELAGSMRDNAARNGLANVRVVEQAVTETTGQAELYVPLGMDMASLDRSWAEQSSTVRPLAVDTVSLDAYFTASGLPLPSLVKIDVEQSEAQVLAGMTEILRRAQPDLIIELLGQSRVQGMAEQLVDDWGYTAYYITNRLQKVDPTALPYEEGFFNFLFTVRSPAELRDRMPLLLSESASTSLIGAR